MHQLKIKRLLAAFVACLLATGLLVSQAGASSFCPSCSEIVFTFDAKIVTGGLLDSSSGPYGTMTLTDAGDNILIDINLTDLAEGQQITEFYLNWAPNDQPNFSLLGTGGSAGDNYVAAFGNYTSGAYTGTFDIWFLAVALQTLQPPPEEPYSGTLSAVLGGNGFNLDPCFFYETDTDGAGLVYASLRVLDDSTRTNVLYRVTATPAECATTPVPEPSTLLLLGGGLAGLAGVTWRRRKNG